MSPHRRISIAVSSDGADGIIDVSGDLVRHADLARLDRSVASMLGGDVPGRVVLRIEGVDMVDLEGIAALLRARRRVAQAGARFAVVDGQPGVRRRLEVAGVLTMLEERGEID